MHKLFTLFLGFALALTMVTAASAQASYRIKSGDTLSIEVLEDAQLNRSLLVLPDGSVDFPFAGSIQAGGRTVGQVQSSITRAIASNFAATPTVFVSVAALRPREAPTTPSAPATINIFFAGEVTTPGLQAVSPRTTFLQAVALSGGFSKFAATKRVQLRRTNAKTGQQSVFLINYKALSRGAAQSTSIFLQEGDVILAPARRLFE